MLDPSNWAGFQDEVVAEEAKSSSRKANRLQRRLTTIDKVLTRLERFQKRSTGLARALRFPAAIAPISADGTPDPSRKQLRIRIPTA
jgi:hypothetical protein